MEQFIDICPTCQNESFENEKCDADFNDVMFDGLAHRAIVDCHKYKEKPKHHLKITYECEGKIATFQRKPTYDLEAYKEYVMNNTEI